MLWLAIPCMIMSHGHAQEAPPVPDDTADDVEECQDSVTELKNRMLGLQFFLQDKKDHEEYCPRQDWEQPALAEYRKDPKSNLPEDCKPEES